MPCRSLSFLFGPASTAVCLLAFLLGRTPAGETGDLDREVRSILSNNCYFCHGPDPNERQADLRLDIAEEALADRGGYAAVVPGRPEESELLRRIQSDDPSERMPPAESGKRLTKHEIELLGRWIEEGARFDRHWSYQQPVQAPLPAVRSAGWPNNEIDYFILARLESEGLTPAAEADRHALIRRVSLDLTGLPPTLAEVDEFVNDSLPGAYERLVGRLLAKEAYGEHWARKWLDLARYADSAGYADDPSRTIWAYRDWVIGAINDNMPFDRFTIEQLAGDLLENPGERQLIATAFHRNTLTNNEGGTNDEEFRNVAIVDRVNTTMAVWMGTTMACAQCHTHKFDPLTQEEYFRLFAIFNNSADADRRDESPLLEIYTAEQERQKLAWRKELAELETRLQTVTPLLAKSQESWEAGFAEDPAWRVIEPEEVVAKSGVGHDRLEDGSLLFEGGAGTDVYRLTLPLSASEESGAENARLTALRLEALPHDSLPGSGPGRGGGNFVVTKVSARLVPPSGAAPLGRFVRIELPGESKILSLAEVQVYGNGENIAPAGVAKQSSTAFQGPAKLAIDGNTDGRYQEAMSTTHTAQSQDPWWEVDLKKTQPVDRIAVFNRTDNNLQSRLNGFRVALLDEERSVVWEQTVAEAPQAGVELPVSGEREIPLAAALAEFSQEGFAAQQVLAADNDNSKGWAIAPQIGRRHALVLPLTQPLDVAIGTKLVLSIEQLSPHENHTIGRLRVSATSAEAAARLAEAPPEIVEIIKLPPADRSEAQQQRLANHYLTIAPELAADRERLAAISKQLAEMKPATTVPIMRELDAGQHRKTQIQRRGNFLDLGEEVSPGVPAVFHELPEGTPDRLALARWLVDEDNPLTARVIVNRYWEAIFGVGLVRTSEEFGSQGELPSHPDLLDWLAVEFVERDWDVKELLRLIVTSAAYRQSSQVTPEAFERDPENRLLARGPRFRLSAEMIRDQALFAGGLLSEKLYGPPVKPLQPKLGLSAAFGGGIDWQPSEGEDRYRRGLYTTWRRSNPYPSMATFDAPNREVCTIRRDRTNTPLQALVTLNDPVFVEAAQALARRIEAAEGRLEEQAAYGFQLCLARPPTAAELERLVALYSTARERLSLQPEQAKQLATDPLGPAPDGADIVDLAAWTVVGNVLLNLDEMFLKR